MAASAAGRQEFAEPGRSDTPAIQLPRLPGNQSRHPQKSELLTMKPVKVFDSPCVHPNGLQWVGDELYVLDQKSDDIFVLNKRGETVRTIGSPTENGSGITAGGGSIWTASNGKTAVRDPRPTDTGLGWVLKLDPQTGEMVDRFRTPDGGGVHGLEWDDGNIWLTAFNPSSNHPGGRGQLRRAGEFSDRTATIAWTGPRRRRPLVCAYRREIGS